MECAGSGGRVEFAEVFGDDDGIGREQREAFAAEEGEGGLVCFGVVVGRVEEDDAGPGSTICHLIAGGETAEGSGDVVRLDGVAAADAERGEVGADGAQGVCGVFDKNNVGGSAADGLDADGPRAGVEIEEDGAGDARSEHVEEGFAQAVAGGARVESFGSNERSGAEFSGDDAHSVIVTRCRPHGHTRFAGLTVQVHALRAILEPPFVALPLAGVALGVTRTKPRPQAMAGRAYGRGEAIQ